MKPDPTPAPVSARLTFWGIAAIGLIYLCTAFAWFLLGGSVHRRTVESGESLARGVADIWGPPLCQEHPLARAAAASEGGRGRLEIRPEASDIRVRLSYDPKLKGLLWHRTYDIEFEAEYRIPNTAPVERTIYVTFKLPSAAGSFTGFTYALGETPATDLLPRNGAITQAISVPAQSTVPLRVSFKSRGMDRWEYLPNPDSEKGRLRNFKLVMETNFSEIDFPAGTGSPTFRERQGDGWKLTWDHPDVIAPRPIGMEMPKALNAGPVAARVSFFAPVSLLFLFATLLIIGASLNVTLHPMNYFFLAAGCFAFQLLFAYLVDVLPVHASFAVAGAVSVALVSGYLWAVAGGRLARVGLAAQTVFMLLFSYSFFFDGLTGLTVAIGSVLTLAILMAATARVNWAEKFSRQHPTSAFPALDGGARSG